MSRFNGGLRETLKAAASAIAAALLIVGYLEACHQKAEAKGATVESVEQRLLKLEEHVKRTEPMADRFLGYEKELPHIQTEMGELRKDIRELRAAILALSNKLP